MSVCHHWQYFTVTGWHAVECSAQTLRIFHIYTFYSSMLTCFLCPVPGIRHNSSSAKYYTWLKDRISAKAATFSPKWNAKTLMCRNSVQNWCLVVGMTLLPSTPLCHMLWSMWRFRASNHMCHTLTFALVRLLSMLQREPASCQFYHRSSDALCGKVMGILNGYGKGTAFPAWLCKGEIFQLVHLLLHSSQIGRAYWPFMRSVAEPLQG